MSRDYGTTDYGLRTTDYGLRTTDYGLRRLWDWRANRQGNRLQAPRSWHATCSTIGMSRDHTRLRAFHLADSLVTCVYRETARFPLAERYGLQGQLRRAAVSVAANIVEGSARRSQSDYLRFLEIALSSACEADYLIDLCQRLEFSAATRVPMQNLQHTYRSVVAATDQLLDALIMSGVRSPESGVRSLGVRSPDYPNLSAACAETE